MKYNTFLVFSAVLLIVLNIISKSTIPDPLPLFSIGIMLILIAMKEKK